MYLMMCMHSLARARARLGSSSRGDGVDFAPARAGLCHGFVIDLLLAFLAGCLVALETHRGPFLGHTPTRARGMATIPVLCRSGGFVSRSKQLLSKPCYWSFEKIVSRRGVRVPGPECAYGRCSRAKCRYQVCMACATVLRSWCLVSEFSFGSSLRFGLRVGLGFSLGVPSQIRSPV